MNVIAELERMGYTCTLDGDMIRYAHNGERPDPATVRPLLATLKANRAEAVQFLQARHGAQPVASWPLPDSIADFLRETGNTLTARNGEHGERLTIAHDAGRSIFDELTAQPEPDTPEAKADLARSIAAAAIREGVPCLADGGTPPDGVGEHDDGPEGWRAYADRWGA